MRTLKSLLIASAAVLTLSAPVLAADAIQEQPPVPAPVEYAPQYSWAGGYTGLYLGYGWNKNKLRTDDDAGNIKPNGVKAGAYAGWNFQQDNIVYGVEGDAGYNWGKKTIDGLQAKQGFEGSLRGRVGIALDPIMPYITAGIAGSQVKLAVDDDSVSKFRVGWTAGVGTEAKLTENIIGRVEYRYTAFGGKDYNFDAGVVNSKLQSHDVRIGVGYKF